MAFSLPTPKFEQLVASPGRLAHLFGYTSAFFSCLSRKSPEAERHSFEIEGTGVARLRSTCVGSMSRNTRQITGSAGALDAASYMKSSMFRT